MPAPDAVLDLLASEGLTPDHPPDVEAQAAALAAAPGVDDPALTDLRGAFALDASSRHRVIHEVSHRLRLPKMALFVERMATPT